MWLWLMVLIRIFPRIDQHIWYAWYADQVKRAHASFASLRPDIFRSCVCRWRLSTPAFFENAGFCPAEIPDAETQEPGMFCTFFGVIHGWEFGVWEVEKDEAQRLQSSMQVA